MTTPNENDSPGAGSDERDESFVAGLRGEFAYEDALPPGMAARLEAGVSRTLREDGAGAGSAWTPRLVIAALVFIAVGIGSGGALTIPAAAATALLALGYVAAVQEEDESVGSDR